MEKLFFFDLETTGLKYWKNGIHQISGAIMIDGEIKEKFNFKVKPHKDCVIEDEALEVAGVTREQIALYPEMSVVYGKIISMLSKYVDKFKKTDKMYLVGFNNSGFDNNFFRAFFTQNAKTDKEREYGNYFGSWFWADTHDVMVFASNYLRMKRTQMDDFKLKSVAKAVGIEVDEEKLHDAAYDIDLTMQIYDRVVIKPNEILKDFDLI